MQREVRCVGFGSSRSRWWNWMGKGKSGSGGENNINRRQRWRLWGASDVQRRKVQNPNVAESEDVVMSITDKPVILRRKHHRPGVPPLPKVYCQLTDGCCWLPSFCATWSKEFAVGNTCHQVLCWQCLSHSAHVQEAYAFCRVVKCVLW